MKHRCEGADANRPTSRNLAQGHSPKLPDMRESTGKKLKQQKDWISSPVSQMCHTHHFHINHRRCAQADKAHPGRGSEQEPTHRSLRGGEDVGLSVPKRTSEGASGTREQAGDSKNTPHPTQ